ncbi:hypothetical protein CYLTODRAFT_423687 [Cylindrobasidium torrendii FP15055 ss-10]|uniref:DUF3533 domain-containing protein n=1 Tax=Cylindrobasidium torrendii FP15055 ss-10 TaxID=1314674 RepID=A0A0D7B6M1_9AGAR|nr:hypothetical protein CYLTODRAFT_423687 [Cylindrobasidium torrendii FP15055 ss-10]
MSRNSSNHTLPLQEEKKDADTTTSPVLFDSQFLDPSVGKERAIFMKVLFGGCMGMILVIFCIFSIYWGALWKVPDHQLPGWVIDFDGGAIGSAVSQGLLGSAAQSKIAWQTVTGLDASEVPVLIREQKAWVAVVINAGASDNLQNADSNYDPTSAVSLYGVEARSENAFRSIIRPVSEATLQSIYDNFARQRVANMSSSTLGSLASSSPQSLTKPVAHTLFNLAPFDVPVASAITFVGLIYLLILSFFIVMVGLSAREVSGLERRLTTRSLITVRLITVFAAYFIISLMYSLLSLAFQVDFSRKFGHSGFLVFWMVNYVGMLSVGLALEAMITLLTVRFVPFFMILWIISNVSVCFMPIEVLPHIYRYGYAMPFYNVSGAVRTILFGTKNELGMHFGILIAWACVSLITLPLFQWYRRRILHKADED